MEEELTIDLDFLSIIRTVIQKIWIILFVGIIGAVTVDFVATKTYVPEYQTSAQFLVVSKKNATYSFYGTTISTGEVAEKFSHLLSSSVMAKEVASDLNFETLPGVIETTPLKESSMIQITVKADTPVNAYNIMNSVISNYGNISKHMDKDAILEPLDEIRMPSAPINAINTKRNLLIGFLGGGLACLALVVLYELFRDDIKTEKHVEKKLDSNLFGVVYQERKNIFRKNRKKTILINDISTGFEYVENIKTIRSKLEYYLRNNHQKSVLVTSALENEGKSTFAVNIALSLGQTGAKVLLVDFDLKKPSIYKIFEINKRDEISIKDVLKNQNLVDKKIHKNVEGIDLLINSESFNDSELLIDNESTSLLFNKLYTMYDYIIVDSAPVLVAEDTLVLSNRLDTTLFVTRQNYGKVQYINDAIDLVKEINGNLIGCVLTRAFRLPLSRAAGYGGYYNYRENHYHRLFKESQAKIEKNNGEGKNA